MKSVIEYKLEEIAKKLDEILKSANELQSSVLQINTALEAMSIAKGEKELIYDVTNEMSERLDKFKVERQELCDLKEACTRRVEKTSFRILKTMAKEGVGEALKEIKELLNSADRYKEVCKDNLCMKNAMDVFRSLEKILEDALAKRREITGQMLNLDFSKLDEDVAEKISPVSNPLRIQILKALAKGKKSYAELERITSAKGGHLRFHLRTLIKSNYVAQERRQGKYLLTSDGLRILKILCQLKD